MPTRIDHLVIGAANLKQGLDFVWDTLGVNMPYGGEHPKMGTHNHLMRLGKGVFLEIISINPELEPPKHPRWFGLDDPLVRHSLAKKPALLTWVVNTPDIHSFVTNADFPAGRPEVITRGDLSWHFALPEDGRLFAGGMLPYAIQWHTETHPSENMTCLDCSLQRLEIHHPYPEWMSEALKSIKAQELVTIHPLPADSTAYMCAYIDTPYGVKELKSII